MVRPSTHVIPLRRNQSSSPAVPSLLLLVSNERLAGTGGDARIGGRAGTESRKGIRIRDSRVAADVVMVSIADHGDRLDF